MPLFQGTYTALITPFRSGRVDFKTLDRLVERQLDAGVDGLIPCGLTGESATLSRGEHNQLIERVIRQAKGHAPVIAGTGSNSTAEALDLSKHAVKAGADGVLIVSPCFNQPTQNGLFEHYATLARAVDAPIMLCHASRRTGVTIAIETMCRLREHHDNIVAIQHATGCVADATELIQSCNIAVFAGDDSLTLPLMSVGAKGVVSALSNLAPLAVRRLTQAILQGDLEEARAAHTAWYPLAKALLTLDTDPVPIKTALALGGFCQEEFRLPLCPMGPDARQRLKTLLADCGLE
jgi:4-hydroxy-tetrahydrodipicolinate synthase